MTGTRAGASADRTALISVLKVTGLSDDAAGAFVDGQGLSTIGCLVQITPAEVDDAVETHNSLYKTEPTKRINSTVTKKRLKALVRQVRLLHYVGETFTTDDWKSNNQVIACVAEMETEDAEKDGATEPSDFEKLTNEKLLDDDFEKVETGMQATLDMKASSHGRGINMGYLTIEAGKTAPATADYATKSQYAAASDAQLKTAAGKRDNKRFFLMLKTMLGGTKAWPTLRRFEKKEDGRGAFLAMKSVFDGEDSTSKRLAKAKRAVKESGDGALLWHTQTGEFKFSDYHSELQTNMEIIHEARGGFGDEAMIERLLAGIQGNAREQQAIAYGIEKVQDMKSTWTYEKAVTYLGERVHKAYGDTLAQKSAREANRKIAESETYNHYHYQGRGGGGGGRGRGFYGGYGGGRGRGRGGRGNFHGRGRGPGGYSGDPRYDGTKEVKMIGDVDTSDANIWSRLDWNQPFVREYSQNRRRILMGQGQGPPRGNNGGYYNHSEANIKQMITEGISAGVAEAMKRQHEGEDDGPNTKKHAGTGTENLGDIMRYAARISTSNRRTVQRSKRIKSMSSSSPIELDDVGSAPNELDTRADTCVLGKNWRYVSDDGQVCSVSGFHSSFKSLKEVPIVRAATGWTDPKNGRTFILYINQGLWFEDMDHSLINPNQIRHFGIPVSDNPYDRTKPLGIDHNKVFIPFETKGATILFDTFKPTEEQIHDDELTHVELTDGVTEWDPQGINMSSNRPYGDQTMEVKAMMRNNPTPDYERNETDMALTTISATLSPESFEQRLISTVVVKKEDVRKVHMAAVGHSNDMVDEKSQAVSESFSRYRHSKVTPERVGRLFGISLDKARRTLDMTTQMGVRTANQGIHRRYRTSAFLSCQPKLNGQFYMDWLSSNTKSLHGDKGAFILSNGPFTESYAKPSRSSDHAADSLREFVNDVGTPEALKVDSAPEFIGRNTEFVDVARKFGIDVTYAEAHRKNQVAPVDVAIRELKKKWQGWKTEKEIPKRIWNYGLKHAAAIMQMTPMEGRRTGYEEVTGKTPDVSELIDFGLWDLVWFLNGTHKSVGEDAKELGRWLGISKKVGGPMTYFIMTRSGKVISESTVQHVTQEEMRNPDMKAKVDEFNRELRERLNDEAHAIEDDWRNQIEDPHESLTNLAMLADKMEATSDGTGDSEQVQKDYWDDTDIGVIDKFIGAKVRLDGPEGTHLATVKCRVTDGTGKPVGEANDNPLLDTREYELELEDGSFERYQANTIAENIYAQTDDEGRETVLLEEICGHRKDGRAVTMADGYTRSSNGEPKPKITTTGWHITVRWKDGSTDELPLRIVKESNPIELAEYAIAAGIMDEPAFKWWVPHVMRKRDRIIKKAKSKYWRTNSKFGIQIPKTVAEALELDRINGNDYWEKAIKKEMKNVRVSYRTHEDHTPDEVRQGKAKNLIGFTEINCRIIFDVKLNFDRKARFVAGGHMTDTPPCMTYSSVVSRDSVRLAFLIAALNGLEVASTDIGNAYLNAPCQEKIWFEAGLECGEDRGKVMIVERALYGLKSSGASWRAMFSDFIINQLGFESTKIDADVYRKKSYYVDSNGNQVAYYELLLVYVDDVLLVSKNPDEVMKQIGNEEENGFRLKDGYSEPSLYLGAEVFKVQLSNGETCWGQGSGRYVKNLVEQVKGMLQEDGRAFKSRSNKEKSHIGPLHPDYHPELDDTDELNQRLTQRYQNIVGMLRWAVELGRIDIQFDVALMSQYLAAPRHGHLEAVYSIVHFLDGRPDRRLLMDPTMPETDETVFNHNANWKEFYGDVVEEDPPGMPTPLGNPVRIKVFLDSDHAGNLVTRRSHSGVFIFVNNALITSYSKKQNTVESATFGAEMVAARVARDLTVALRIKLKMFGVPIDGPADFYCDNNSVVKNISIPTSMLAKRHNAINYHIIRESAAAGILRMAKENTLTNPADALTKIHSWNKRQLLIGNLLYYPSEMTICE